MSLQEAKVKVALKNDSGAVAIEYVIMASVMALMLIPTMALLADKLQVSYDLFQSWF